MDILNSLWFLDGLSMTSYLALVAGSVTLIAGKKAAEKYIAPLMDDDRKALLVFLGMMAALGLFVFRWW